MSSTDPGPSAAYYARFPAGADGPQRPPTPPLDPLLEPSQTAAQFVDSARHDGLYAILNVARDASLSEIKDRYRTLASVYHPDKQPDDARRRAATGRFQEIQRAHEVLTDPARRTVYDMFGEEGLRTSWEVGPRNMTPAQMRRFYSKQRDTLKRLDAEALVNSKGDMNLTLDARGVFLPESAFDDPKHRIDHSAWGRAQRLAVGQTTLKHSFETPLSEHTQLVMEGTMAAMGGHGGANLSGTVRHQFSPRIWGQFTQSVLFPRITTVKANYNIDEMTFFTVNAISQSVAAPPRMTFTMGRQLWPSTTGFINYSTGFFSLGSWGANIPDELALQDTGSMSVGVTNAGADGRGFTVEAAAGLTATALNADYTTFALGLRLKLGAGYDFMDGLHGFADATAKVTENTRAGAMLKLATTGVRIVFHFGRVGQKIRIPILLSFYADPKVILWSTVIPATAWAGFYHWVMVPRKQKRIERRIKRLQREHAEFIAQKRAEAADAVLLMERGVAQRADAERAKNGLVILDAHYGRSTAFTARGLRDEFDDKGNPAVIDVTVPVQALVSAGKLYIPQGPAKHNLLGFYDPCIGENKKLRVRYLFHGRVHEIEVDDVSALRAPVKAHAVDN